jgi:hypothetical protein
MINNGENIMNLNETISYLSNQFENQPSPFTKQEILNECFQMLKQDIHILETMSCDILKQDNTKQIELITQSLFIFIQYLIIKPLSSDTILFITNMLQFIFNWNQNITKLETIELLSKLIYQHINAIEQINITIETLQKTIGTYQDLQNWMPPAYDIAKIYCDELLKQNE